jgi:hypothetical protein
MWFLLTLKFIAGAVTVFGKQIVNFFFDVLEYFEEKKRK